jgi:hypothetical protein
MHSIEVADLIDSGSSEVLFARLRAAFVLLQAHDARRFQRLLKDISCVVFLESGPEFWIRGRICVLQDVSSFTDAQLAATLVHEATHARLYAAGIAYSSESRSRIETLCVREELAFLVRVPDSDDLIERTKRKLENPWWTAEAVYERHLDSLEAAGAPTILTRAYQRLARRRLRKADQRDS